MKGGTVTWLLIAVVLRLSALLNPIGPVPQIETTVLDVSPSLDPQPLETARSDSATTIDPDG
jgi:hypothetical protein